MRAAAAPPAALAPRIVLDDAPTISVRRDVA
jgi:hypothetical protein